MRIIEKNTFGVIARTSAKSGSESFVTENNLHKIWEPEQDDNAPEITGRFDGPTNAVLVDNVKAEKMFLDIRDAGNVSVYSEEIDMKSYSQYNGNQYIRRYWADIPEQQAGHTLTVRLEKGEILNPCIGMIFAGQTLSPFDDPEYPYSDSPDNYSDYWELDGGYVETADGNLVRKISVTIKITNDREQYFALKDRLDSVRSKPCAWLLCDSAGDSERHHYAIFGLIPPKSPYKSSINKHSTGVIQIPLIRECI